MYYYVSVTSIILKLYTLHIFQYLVSEHIILFHIRL